MQEYWVGTGEAAIHIHLPPPDDEVMPGVLWGRGEMLDTAAYWVLRCMCEADPLHGFTSENGSLLDEIGFCLLGGFGITAELNGAAYKRLKTARVFDLTKRISEDQIKGLLNEPLSVAGRTSKYRFPNQRARRITTMRRKLTGIDMSGLTIAGVRRILVSLEGIGPKTAAWIIRNHFDSDEVAILDIHVIRACKRLKVFPDNVTLPRDYEPLQDAFLAFAQALKVRPAVLDAVMWNDMRALPTRRSKQLATI